MSDDMCPICGAAKVWEGVLSGHEWECGREEGGGPFIACPTSEGEVERLREREDAMTAVFELMISEDAFAVRRVDGSMGFELLCSDTFAWGMADCEALPISAAREVLRIKESEGWPGIARWVQTKRGGSEENPFISAVEDAVLEEDSMRSEITALRAQLDGVMEAVEEEPVPFMSHQNLSMRRVAESAVVLFKASIKASIKALGNL